MASSQLFEGAQIHKRGSEKATNAELRFLDSQKRKLGALHVARQANPEMSLRDHLRVTNANWAGRYLTTADLLEPVVCPEVTE